MFLLRSKFAPMRWYEEPDTTTQQPPENPDTNGNGAGGDSGKLTQEQVNKLVGDARVQGRESGLKALLEELGMENADALKALVNDVKTKADAEKSELQKAQEQLAKLQGGSKAAEALKTKLEAAEAAIKAQVEAQVKSLKVPKHITALMEKMEPTEQLAWLAENLDTLKASTQTTTDTDAGKRGSGKNRPDEKTIRAKYGIS